MNKITLLTMVAALAGWPTAPAVAQESNVVPTLVSFSGTLTDLDHKPLSGIVGVTFCIFRDQQGGTPLWMETQNVQLDKEGKYAAQLGSTKSHGLPTDLFASGEARWLGVQAQGQQEQPRVMLLSVPYALKAADAQTVGGLPPSAFVLAAPRASTSSIIHFQTDSAIPTSTPTGTGTTNYVPLWTSSSNLGNSILSQGSGYINIGGALRFPALGRATTSAGYSSQPLDLFASVYNSSVGVVVPQHFRWEAEPVTNNTSSASGKLDFLYASGTATPTETGLSISSKGILTFAPGQTLPHVAGNETVSGNVSASQVISTVAQGTAPLKVISTTQVANLNASYLGGIAATGFAKIGANTLTGNQVINGTGPADNYGLTVNQPTQTGIAIQAPVSGVGAGLDFYTTGSAGKRWEVLATGNSSAQGTGKFNIRDINTVIDVFTIDTKDNVFVRNLTATGPSGSGTDGTLGVTATGGNGDQNVLSVGGDGLVAQGGAAGGCNFSGCGIGGTGVIATGGQGLSNGIAGDGIVVWPGGAEAWAGYFGGDVDITGTLYAGAKNFKIDHPLDPARKYLVHASIESSEMMNLYSGNVTTDAQGESTVQLPSWFVALNRDFRYQLTVIGQFAQAIIARKIENHQFTIRTNAPNVEVSWQVTGLRQDAYAQAHPLVVEEEKPARLQGFYIHPELHGAPPEKQLEWARHPQLMKSLKEQREKQGALTAAAKAR
jgi:hypothetical protein